MTRAGCNVCLQLLPERIVILDELLADPRKWKSETAWGALVPMRMTPAARAIGATNIGVEHLHQQGYVSLDRRDVIRHYRRHVAPIVYDPDELVDMVGGTDPRGQRARERGMVSAAKMYQKAIDLGSLALTELTNRLEKRLRANVPIENAELHAYAELGAKMAVSAAALKKAGADVFGSDEDSTAGFRVGGGGRRVGHHRMHIIDGESVPVRDEGPKDRAEYNARALTEGREGLG